MLDGAQELARRSPHICHTRNCNRHVDSIAVWQQAVHKLQHILHITSLSGEAEESMGGMLACMCQSSASCIKATATKNTERTPKACHHARALTSAKMRTQELMQGTQSARSERLLAEARHLKRASFHQLFVQGHRVPRSFLAVRTGARPSVSR